MRTALSHSKKVPPIEIHRQLVEVYGEKCIDVKNVRKWCRKFSGSRENVHNDRRSGRPSLPDSLTTRIEEMVLSNRRITLYEIVEGLNEEYRYSTVQNIVSEVFGYNKVSARWVPRQLTNEHKRKSVEYATECVRRHEKEGEEFLDSIVSGDETWVHHYTPETKVQSKQWRHPTSPKPKRSRPRSQRGRLWQPFSGTGREFFWWNSCQKEQQSTLRATARRSRTFGEPSKTKEGVCSRKACVWIIKMRVHMCPIKRPP